eukprot:15431088-Alexandrium_andersonii.AAC.1
MSAGRSKQDWGPPIFVMSVGGRRSLAAAASAKPPQRAQEKGNTPRPALRTLARDADAFARWWPPPPPH